MMTHFQFIVLLFAKFGLIVVELRSKTKVQIATLMKALPLILYTSYHHKVYKINNSTIEQNKPEDYL